MLRSLLLSLAFVTPAAAQGPSVAELTPGIDVLESFPTFTEVETMKRSLEEAVEGKNCKQVIAQSGPFAAEAAVLIAVAGEAMAPARGAATSAATMLGSSAEAREVQKRTKALVVARGEAFAATADCFASSGKQGEAVRFYVKALNAIPADETDLWRRAATGLWNQLGASSPQR